MKHEIFDIYDAKAIINNDPEKGEDAFSELFSSSDDHQERYFKHIEKISKDPNKGYRDALIATDTMIIELENEKNVFPNMIEVIELIQRNIAFSKVTTRALDLPPIILNGGPGIGKTRFVKRLASILGTQDKIISVNTLSGSDYFSGLSRSFNRACAGVIASELINGTTSAPLFVLDEIEKFSPKAQGSQYEELYNVLHSYFEKENATSVTDEYYQLSFNCSYILWFATSNKIDNIPASFLDRVTIIDIPSLTTEQIHTIIMQYFQAFTKMIDLPIEITEDAIDAVSKNGLRQAQKLLKNAIGHMLLEKRLQLTKGDIEKIAPHSNKQEKRPIGFI